ncbi:zinc-binding dehydrogenase [Paraflavitalea speifideaquila]|uniref:zinc-binding dehydrogenase n=1 Tax=Paraflavitalea speifideaquila TaxID=3076558 RepID=UPI0028EE4FE2|nr:zinc-binding dehydrogenase [Paraflavitalea speifideiaquila]
MGHELSGDLLQVDPDTGFAPGDPVAIIPYLSCGHCVACRSGKPNCCVTIQVCGVHIDGGMVQYLQVPVTALLPGQALSYDELALVEPLAIGAHGIRRAGVKKNDNVLVIGAGPIGLAAMEFARVAGARVIAMDLSDDKLAFCRSQLSIAHTLNPMQGNTVEQLQTITRGDMATVVVDATGNLVAINRGIDYLAHGGTFVLIGLQKKHSALAIPIFINGNQHL